MASYFIFFFLIREESLLISCYCFTKPPCDFTGWMSDVKRQRRYAVCRLDCEEGKQESGQRGSVTVSSVSDVRCSAVNVMFRFQALPTGF